MSVVITGASGLLGREIHKQFNASPDFNEVIGMGYSRAENLVKCDLLDFELTNELITKMRPRVIIHSAGEKRPDVISKNPEYVYKLNVLVTKNLAKLALDLNCVYIYISTDYVFDGHSPPYKTFDTPNPLNEYGKSKLVGEAEAIKVNPNTVVLRLPSLYGVAEKPNESTVNFLIDLVMKSQDTIVQDDYFTRYPTCIEDVARILVEMARKCLLDKTIKGIFQFSSEEKTTKYKICLQVASILGKDSSKILPDRDPSEDQLSTRPKDSHVSSDRLQDIGIDISWTSLNEWMTKNVAIL